MSHKVFGPYLYQKFLFIYQKFRLNWVSCLLSGRPLEEDPWLAFTVAGLGLQGSLLQRGLFPLCSPCLLPASGPAHSCPTPSPLPSSWPPRSVLSSSLLLGVFCSLHSMRFPNRLH